MATVKGLSRRARAEDERQRKAAAQRALDTFQNFAAKLGMGTDNLMAQGTYGFNPITRIRNLLEWIHRGSWVGGLAVDVVADDMTRAGIHMKGVVNPEDAEKIQTYVTRIGMWNGIHRTIKWARLYGGAIGVFMIDGQKTETPLRVETIGKDSFKGILALDRWMLAPSLEHLVTDMGPNLGLPKFYKVTNQAPAFQGQKIHYSRVFRMIGLELPFQQAVQEMLWGLSVIERLYDRLIAFDSGTQGAAQLIFKAHLRTLSVEGLRDIVTAGGKVMEGLANYTDMMRRFQSNEGMTLIDTKDKFEVHQASAMGGIADALVQLGQQISGALQIPLVRLFGQSPTGLNSSGESDLRTYYDGINNNQNATMLVPVTDAYRCAAYSCGVQVDDGFGIGFNPLWQMTDKEKADIASSVTSTVTQAYEANLINQQTAMRELRASADTTGIMSNITDEDIEAAETEMAPEPEPEEEQLIKEGDDPDEGPEDLSVTGDVRLGQGGGRSERRRRAKQMIASLEQKLKNDLTPAERKEIESEIKEWQADLTLDVKKLRRQRFRDSLAVAARLNHAHGIETVIESAKGTPRKGNDWSVVMPADYGYIRKTMAGDGDQLDCFIGSNPESTKVFVISQLNGDGDFDEYKVMFGYDSMDEAQADYLKSYDHRGRDMLGDCEEMAMEEFKKWLNSSFTLDEFKESEHPRGTGKKGGQFVKKGEGGTVAIGEGPEDLSHPETHKKIHEMYKQGMSTGKIAKELGHEASPETRRKIRAALRKAGLYKEMGGLTPIIPPTSAPPTKPESGSSSHDPLKTREYLENKTSGPGKDRYAYKFGTEAMVGKLHQDVVNSAQKVYIVDKYWHGFKEEDGTRGLYSRDMMKIGLEWKSRPGDYVHEYGHHLTMNIYDLANKAGWDDIDVRKSRNDMLREYDSASGRARDYLAETDDWRLKGKPISSACHYLPSKIADTGPSAYGFSNELEWQAESFRMYFYHGEILKKRCPKTWEFMDKLIGNKFKKRDPQ